MVRTIWQTQEFGPITASNDETVSVLLVLLLCVQIGLSCDFMRRCLVRESREADAFRGTPGIRERRGRQCRDEYGIFG
jgi:hypothetical protein